MKRMMARNNWSNLARIVVPFLVLVGVVYARAHVVENIRPWEPLWCLWVLSTIMASACLGWMVNDVWRTRR